VLSKAVLPTDSELSHEIRQILEAVCTRTPPLGVAKHDFPQEAHARAMHMWLRCLAGNMNTRRNLRMDDRHTTLSIGLESRRCFESSRSCPGARQRATVLGMPDVAVPEVPSTENAFKEAEKRYQLHQSLHLPKRYVLLDSASTSCFLLHGLKGRRLISGSITVAASGIQFLQWIAKT
jgi:hypothetical protein